MTADRLEELLVDGVDLDDPLFVLAVASLSIERLAGADTSGLGDDARRWFTTGVEALRNQADAAAVGAAGGLEAAGHDRDLGYFTSGAWLRHFCQVSPTEARARMQVSRLFAEFPAWEAAAQAGELGMEQARLAARTWARERCKEAFTDAAEVLLRDAIESSYARFEELLSNLRRLAEAASLREQAEAAQVRRRASMRRLADGSWRLTADFGDLQGAEINHYLAHFFDAEWRTDWADARERLGDDTTVTMGDLRRTEMQRRADAVHQMVLAAASGGDGRAPLPTLDILFDHDTFVTEVSGGVHDPSRFGSMVCRTRDGAPIEFSQAASAALLGHVRRVVLDAAGVVIDLGRRRRLFDGAAREAAQLMHTTCIWFGCEAPVRTTAVDHHHEWHRHRGRTDQCNAGPLCDAHNLLKERMRYVITRQPDGTFTITDANGVPLG